MAKYRDGLPQLSGGTFLTDGGLETTLVFQDRLDLPCFAAFALLRDEDGRARLRRYYARYAAIARQNSLGFIFDSVTWRANRDWGDKMGYSAAALAEANRLSISLLAQLRAEYESALSPMVLSGAIGPRGDGYNPAFRMSAAEAEAYHAEQIAVFAGTEADMVAAFTLNYVEEAIGIARAAATARMPVAISFTVETDGRLPTGQTLKEAITEVEEATAAAPAYFMINCAHPSHFAGILADEPWMRRVRGLRGNASKKSHAELDGSTELDSGNPLEFGMEYRDLLRRFPHINVLGGCCGTDHRHIEAICGACVPRYHIEAA